MIIDYSLVNLFSFQTFKIALKLAKLHKYQMKSLLQDFRVVVHFADLLLERLRAQLLVV